MLFSSLLRVQGPAWGGKLDADASDAVYMQVGKLTSLCLRQPIQSIGA